MKKQFLLVALGFGTLVATAQNSAVNKADGLVKKQDYMAAKEMIDGATAHDKTKDKPKTWFVKGQVYAGLSESASNSEESNKYLTEALASFNKAKELEKDNGTYFIFADQSIQALYATPFNAGVENFNSQDFETALVNFQKAMMVNPEDSNAVINAYVAASQIGDDDKVIEMLNRLLDVTSNKDYYFALVNYQLDKRENYDEAAKVLDKGQQMFPDDVNFSKLKVNMYLKQKKNDEAKAELETAIAGDPTNADLVFLKGYLNEQTEDFPAAIEAYKKAQEINPEHASSAFNLGALYYNTAAETVKRANNMGTSKSEEAKRKVILEEAKVQFKEAVPYLETAVKLNPNDAALMDRLMVAYYRAGEKAKGDAIGDRIEKLNAAE